MKKYFLIFLMSFSFLFAEIRAVWVPFWEIVSKEKIDTIVQDAKENGFNEIILQVRYRSNAIYFPNKNNRHYKNKENFSSQITDKNFDPLEYFIKKAKKNNLKVIAWATVFVCCNSEKQLEDLNINKKWLTLQKDKRKTSLIEKEGFFFDPALKEVQDYLLNIFMDIIVNYDLDGFQMDYIRYPEKDFGYNKTALKIFNKNYKDKLTWQEFKIKNVSDFVRNFYKKAKKEKPNLEISAAVYADYYIAKNDFSQDWIAWLNENYIDKVYLMAYAQDTEKFKNAIFTAIEYEQKDKIVIGLRAWTDFAVDYYPNSEILDKMEFLKQYDFAGYSFFCYGGMKKNGYLNFLKLTYFYEEN